MKIIDGDALKNLPEFSMGGNCRNTNTIHY